VPSTGAACLLVQQVNRTNMGLTLDFGHLLAAGENPAQSLALVEATVGRDKLFGVQLNDGCVATGLSTSPPPEPR
jgi:sugar phosphate isomerase/epimerase